jgi:prophage maintenance system killer protein
MVRWFTNSCKRKATLTKVTFLKLAEIRGAMDQAAACSFGGSASLITRKTLRSKVP